MPDPRTHVLYIAEYSTGGSIESLLTLVAGLDKREFRATVLFYRMPDESIRERIQDSGAEIASLYPPASGKSARGQLKKYNLQKRIRKYFGKGVERAYSSLKYMIYFARFRRSIYRDLRRKLESLQPDLAHLNTGVANDTPAALAARARRIPTVGHVRDLDELTYLSVVAARSVRKFICISSAVRDKLIKYGIPPEKTVVIPNAVDLTRFDSSNVRSADIRSEFGWAQSDTVFVLAGRIVSWKGHSDFVQAMAIAHQTDRSLRGLIVGEGDHSEESDAYISRLKTTILDLGVGDSVKFAGHRTDIPEIMKSADGVVCPSSSPEPFGRVIIESMAVGTPVIATAAGGATDIIADGTNGLLVPPKDASALAAALLRLTHDRDLSVRLCSNALLDVKDRFSVGQHVQSICEIYRSVLGKP